MLACGVVNSIAANCDADGTIRPFTALARFRSVAWRRALKFIQEKYGRTRRWQDLRAAFITNVAKACDGMMA